jgi:hypothetical protein
MDASVSGPSHSSMTESGTKRKYEGKISFPFFYCISKAKPTFIKGTLFAVWKEQDCQEVVGFSACDVTIVVVVIVLVLLLLLLQLFFSQAKFSRNSFVFLLLLEFFVPFDRSLTVGRINRNIDDRQLYIHISIYSEKYAECRQSCLC